ncbi:MAG: hypothetical protein JWQ88_3308 [Rhodoferax sp.]|nr:hypothetical protein [Rhodoferax sp.]
MRAVPGVPGMLAGADASAGASPVAMRLADAAMAHPSAAGAGLHAGIGVGEQAFRAAVRVLGAVGVGVFTDEPRG